MYAIFSQKNIPYVLAWTQVCKHFMNRQYFPCFIRKHCGKFLWSIVFQKCSRAERWNFADWLDHKNLVKSVCTDKHKEYPENTKWHSVAKNQRITPVEDRFHISRDLNILEGSTGQESYVFLWGLGKTSSSKIWKNGVRKNKREYAGVGIWLGMASRWALLSLLPQANEFLKELKF